MTGMCPKYMDPDKNTSPQYHRTPIHLGPRLAAVADLVQRILTSTKLEDSATPGNARGQWTLADIGSDHAYVPAFLLQQKAIEKAIAVDVHEGPYQNMQHTVELYGLEEYLEPRRGDGLSDLTPGEAQIIVLAGMGGTTIEKILGSNEAVVREAQGLVLQPQNAFTGLYHTLWARGWKLNEEMVAEEGREIYRLMAWQRLQGWDAADIKMNIIRWQEAVCPEARNEDFAKCIWLLGPKNVEREEAFRECGHSRSGELLKLLGLHELARLARVRVGLSRSEKKENEHKLQKIDEEEGIWKNVLAWLFP